VHHELEDDFHDRQEGHQGSHPNRAVWLPLLVVPLIFVVLMPLGMILGISTVRGSEANP